MILAKRGKVTILDGKGTLVLNKNGYGLDVSGFGADPLEIKNQHLLGQHGFKGKRFAKRVQLKESIKFIYSDEIKKTNEVSKDVAVKSLGGLIALVIGVVLSSLTKIIK